MHEHVRLIEHGNINASRTEQSELCNSRMNCTRFLPTYNADNNLRTLIKDLLVNLRVVKDEKWRPHSNIQQTRQPRMAK